MRSATASIALLAHLLDSDERVTPRGVAQVMRLLGNPASPLKSPTGNGERAIEARSIRAALEDA